METGETSLPQLLTGADLIALMEKHGIGTDASHAEHIEIIKSREYVLVQSDGWFLPSPPGIALVKGYEKMNISPADPSLQAELEDDLKM